MNEVPEWLSEIPTSAKLDEVERHLVLRALRICNGNRSHAATMLGLALRTVRNKINVYRSQGIYVTPPVSQRTKSRRR